jgi:hypothetical protein
MENNLIKFLESFELTDNGVSVYDFNVRQLIDANIGFLNKLKTFEEFKNVKKINVIPMPSYYGDKDTGQPINSIENYLGGNGKVFQVPTYMYRPSEPKFEFNEEIDLYSLALSPKTYDNTNLDCGVWKYPLQYDPEKFSPINKIEIKYSLEEIKDAKNLSDEEAIKEAKRIILEQVSLLIDQKESNLPHSRGILIRCSERSMNKIKTN